MLRLKKWSNFLSLSNFIRGCSKCVQIALFVSWNNFDSQCLFLMAIRFPTFSSIIALLASWKLLELLYIGPATFRTQIEQIRTHIEQCQKRLETKWKIWIFFEPQLKKLEFMLKINSNPCGWGRIWLPKLRTGITPQWLKLRKIFKLM